MRLGEQHIREGDEATCLALRVIHVAPRFQGHLLLRPLDRPL